MSKKPKESKVVQVQMDKELVEKAENILKDLGLDRTTALKIYYRQIVLNNGLPFEMVPNKETIEALNEDLTHAKRYTDLDEMWKDILED
ncbi:type II toxin-antitoxin system RelB/DinJ family antitoxin [Tetragenococcus halophilus]|uniref:type II toxin-antitoxin system RelB/DinJ family antitoxin n=1 Tax=Tetragenococcus halophilus TaxID=51669 RepID=UPI001F478606|nr:type II toxin-antitoxin system RelB/DinJ family antitoxin [Tetragenococcus halophilus]MCF1685768.1 type II toxin-antitoxin system RelB/DinJ family antitoxin [Tetragenococcus halophilus]